MLLTLALLYVVGMPPAVAFLYPSHLTFHPWRSLFVVTVYALLWPGFILCSLARRS